jgi:hypothetical protein
VFEAIRAVRDGSRSHPPLAFGTKRTVDWQQLWVGFSPAAHNGKKNSANLNIRLSGTEQTEISILAKFFRGKE